MPSRLRAEQWIPSGWSPFLWPPTNLVEFSYYTASEEIVITLPHRAPSRMKKVISFYLPLNFKMGSWQTLLCHLQSKMSCRHKHCLTLFWDFHLAWKGSENTPVSFHLEDWWEPLQNFSYFVSDAINSSIVSLTWPIIFWIIGFLF